MLIYARCDLRCVLHMLCMYVVTFHCSNAILDQWRRWGREASKTELKDMFQLSNDLASQKEDITLFDSKRTSIHSLIIQHVYTLKK